MCEVCGANVSGQLDFLKVPIDCYRTMNLRWKIEVARGKLHLDRWPKLRYRAYRFMLSLPAYRFSVPACKFKYC